MTTTESAQLDKWDKTLLLYAKNRFGTTGDLERDIKLLMAKRCGLYEEHVEIDAVLRWMQDVLIRAMGAERYAHLINRYICESHNVVRQRLGLQDGRTFLVEYWSMLQGARVLNDEKEVVLDLTLPEDFVEKHLPDELKKKEMA